MLDNSFKKFSWYHYLPDHKLDIHEENVLEFFEYMYERQEIWYRRHILKKPAPWTSNPILRDYKFTNVYRELDRSSQWLIHNVIRKPYNSKEDLVFRIMLYKYFNNPDTFDKVELPHYENFNSKEFGKMIDMHQNVHGNAFSTAYMINTTQCKGQKRHTCYCNIHVPHLHKSIPSILKAIKIAEQKDNVMILIDELKKLQSVSDFLAHEFYQDFTYVPRYTDDSVMRFQDTDFCNVGPGCSSGIRFMFPNCKNIQEQEERLYLLWEMAPEYLNHFGKFKYITWDKEKEKYNVTPGKGNILLHTCEFFACEFQKIKKMQFQEGKQRSKFTPKTKII